MGKSASKAINVSDIESLVDALPEFLAETKCPNCNSSDKSMYHRVEGIKNVRFCSSCDTLFGIDDSMNVNDLRQFMEEGNVRFKTANACACGNDDVDAFMFEQCKQSGELYLKCMNCDLELKESMKPSQRINSAESCEPPLFESYENTTVNLLRILKRGDQDAWKRCGSIYNHHGIVVEVLRENRQQVIHNTVAKDGTRECLEQDEVIAVSPPDEVLLTVSYEKTKVTSLGTLKRGDHIAWKRCGGIYSHHAIVAAVLGENKLEVIHNAAAKEGKAANRGAKCQILREIIDSGHKKGNLYLCKYKAGECLEPDRVIARAISLLGKKNYHLFLSNCEHFATFCKTARRFSMQVKRFVIAQLLIPVPLIGGLIGCTIGNFLESFLRKKQANCSEAVLRK